MTPPDPTTLEAMRRDAAAARLALADGTLDRAGVERLIRYVERLTALREPVQDSPKDHAFFFSTCSTDDAGDEDNIPTTVTITTDVESAMEMVGLLRTGIRNAEASGDLVQVDFGPCVGDWRCSLGEKEDLSVQEAELVRAGVLVIEGEDPRP